LLREAHAIFHCHVVDWNERDHIRRADPWVLAVMCAKVNEFDRLFDGAQSRCGHCIWRAGERQHAAIVVGVGRAVEQRHTGNAADSVCQRVDFSGVAAFGKVRDALD
jgi:hypothetical protein